MYDGENKNQGGQQYKKKFLDPQNLTEQVEVEPRNIYSQKTSAAYLQPGEEQEQESGGPLKPPARWAYETVFVFHEKTGRE